VSLVILLSVLYGALWRATSPYTVLLGLSVIAVAGGQALGVRLWRQKPACKAVPASAAETLLRDVVPPGGVGGQLPPASRHVLKGFSPNSQGGLTASSPRCVNLKAMGDARSRERPHDNLKEDTHMDTTYPEPDSDHRSGLWRLARLAAIGAVLVALVFGVVRATGREAESSGGHERPSGSSGQFTVEQMTEFAQCMRDQGLDMSDPQVTADGRVDPMKPGAGVDPNGPAFQEGLSVCQARFAPAAAGGGGGHP